MKSLYKSFIVLFAAISITCLATTLYTKAETGPEPELTAEELEMFKALDDYFRSLPPEEQELINKMGKQLEEDAAKAGFEGPEGVFAYIDKMAEEGKILPDLKELQQEQEPESIPELPARKPNVSPVKDANKIQQAERIVTNILNRITALRHRVELMPEIKKELGEISFNLDDLVYYLTVIKNKKLTGYLATPEFDVLFDILKELSGRLDDLEPQIQIVEFELSGETPQSILGVGRRASNDEIRSAYRRLVNTQGPETIEARLIKQGIKGDELDKQVDAARKSFKKYTKAYDALINKQASDSAVRQLLQTLYDVFYNQHIIDEIKKLFKTHEPAELALREAQEKREALARKDQDERARNALLKNYDFSFGSTAYPQSANTGAAPYYPVGGTPPSAGTTGRTGEKSEPRLGADGGKEGAKSGKAGSEKKEKERKEKEAEKDKGKESKAGGKGKPAGEMKVDKISVRLGQIDAAIEAIDSDKKGSKGLNALVTLKIPDYEEPIEARRKEFFTNFVASLAQPFNPEQSDMETTAIKTQFETLNAVTSQLETIKGVVQKTLAANDIDNKKKAFFLKEVADRIKRLDQGEPDKPGLLQQTFGDIIDKVLITTDPQTSQPTRLLTPNPTGPSTLPISPSMKYLWFDIPTETRDQAAINQAIKAFKNQHLEINEPSDANLIGKFKDVQTYLRGLIAEAAKRTKEIEAAEKKKAAAAAAAQPANKPATKPMPKAPKASGAPAAEESAQEEAEMYNPPVD